MAVSIVRSNLQNVSKNLERLLSLIHYKPAKEKIWLKPNIGSQFQSYREGDYTCPQLVEALIQYFDGCEIIIGEGCAVGMDLNKGFDRNGYRRLEKKYRNVTLLDLETLPKEERFSMKWKYGTLRVPKLLKTHEYINLPSLKTNFLTWVTLGCKNQKGLLLHKDKKWFHREDKVDIHDALYQLSVVLKPDLTIIDGIIGVEGDGPTTVIARKKRMNILIAGQDVYEVDNVGCAVMNLDAAMARHLPTVRYEVVGERIEDVKKPFRRPRIDKDFRMLNFHVTMKPCCTGCVMSFQGALLEMLKPYQLRYVPGRLNNFVRYGILQSRYFLWGHDPVLPQTYGKATCFGNCSLPFAKEHGIKHVKGCPPQVEDILKEF